LGILKIKNLFFLKIDYNFFLKDKIDYKFICLEVLAQLANAEIARPDVVTRVRIQDLTVVCEFIFGGLPLSKTKIDQKKNCVSLFSVDYHLCVSLFSVDYHYLRPKKKKKNYKFIYIFLRVNANKRA
jgi:hypothetical protein